MHLYHLFFYRLPWDSTIQLSTEEEFSLGGFGHELEKPKLKTGSCGLLLAGMNVEMEE